MYNVLASMIMNQSSFSPISIIFVFCLGSCRPTAAGNATGLVCIDWITREDDLPHRVGLCGTVRVNPNPLWRPHDYFVGGGGLCHVVARDFDPPLILREFVLVISRPDDDDGSSNNSMYVQYYIFIEVYESTM
jgi:hypothetical protein